MTDVSEAIFKVLTLKMTSTQVVEMPFTNSPSQDSNHPDDLFQSRNSVTLVLYNILMTFYPTPTPTPPPPKKPKQQLLLLNFDIVGIEKNFYCNIKCKSKFLFIFNIFNSFLFWVWTLSQLHCNLGELLHD